MFHVYIKHLSVYAACTPDWILIQFVLNIITNNCSINSEDLFSNIRVWKHQNSTIFGCLFGEGQIKFLFVFVYINIVFYNIFRLCILSSFLLLLISREITSNVILKLLFSFLAGHILPVRYLDHDFIIHIWSGLAFPVPRL